MKHKSPPVISQISVLPQSGPGGTIFSAAVVAGGHPPLSLSYQWQLEGVEIAGAAESQFVSATAGALRVLVTATNREGSDVRLSQPVIVAPASAAVELVAIRIEPQTGDVGHTFTVVTEATGVPEPVLSYQWLLDGALIPGATAASYEAQGAGMLSVRVVASNGHGVDGAESAAVPVGRQGVAPAITSVEIVPEASRVGESFAAAVTVTGEPAPVLSYHWLLDGEEIAGAIGESVVPPRAGALSIEVTARNGAGSATAQGGPAFVAPALAAPVVEAVVIAPVEGMVGTMFEASAIVAGEPMPVAEFQWLLDGVPIAGASERSFVAADEGLLTVLVRAVNTLGARTLESAAVTVEARGATPANTAAPALSGTAQVGLTLTASAGRWTGTPAPALALVWQRNGVDITGATDLSYALVDGDAGSDVRVKVEATNSLGSAAAYSDAVRVAASGAPVIVPLSNRSYQRNTGIQSYDIGALTTGTGITWSIDPTEISAGATSLTVTAMPDLSSVTIVAEPTALRVEAA